MELTVFLKDLASLTVSAAPALAVAGICFAIFDLFRTIRQRNKRIKELKEDRMNFDLQGSTLSAMTAEMTAAIQRSLEENNERAQQILHLVTELREENDHLRQELEKARANNSGDSE